MRVSLFSIRDVKAGCYLAPFVARSAVDARRSITQGFRDPNMRDTPVGTHPGDFELFEIAYLDDESGVITPFGPQFICGIAELAPSSTVSS